MVCDNNITVNNTRKRGLETSRINISSIIQITPSFEALEVADLEALNYLILSPLDMLFMCSRVNSFKVDIHEYR